MTHRHDDIPDTDWAALLYAALAAPRGVLILASDAAGGRQKLYTVRTKLADPALEVLQIRMSPLPEGNLIIVRGDRSLPKPTYNPDLLDL